MKCLLLGLLVAVSASAQTQLGESGPYILGPPYTDTGSPGLTTDVPKLTISSDSDPGCSNHSGQDILRLVTPRRAATSWRWTCNGDMLGSTTLTVSGNTAGLIQFWRDTPAATQYMIGVTSDEYPVDPVLMVGGNQGELPDFDNSLWDRQPIFLGVGHDRSHTFSLLANGRMGVGLENAWTGTLGSGTITTERITEQIVIPNGAYLGARNADDSATDKLIGYDANGQVEIAPGGQTTTFGGDVRINGALVADSIRSLNEQIQALQAQIATLQVQLSQHGTPVYHVAETAPPASVSVAEPPTHTPPHNCTQLGKSKLVCW